MVIVLAMHHRYLLVIMLDYLFCYVLFIGRAQLLLLFIYWLFSPRLDIGLLVICLICYLLILDCLQSFLDWLVIYLLVIMYLFIYAEFLQITCYYSSYENGTSPSNK